MNRHDAPISNYYGTPAVFKHEGRCYFSLDCVGDSACVEVSEAFYTAFCQEFQGDYDYAPGWVDVAGYVLKVRAEGGA